MERDCRTTESQERKRKPAWRGVGWVWVVGTYMLLRGPRQGWVRDRDSGEWWCASALGSGRLHAAAARKGALCMQQWKLIIC